MTTVAGMWMGRPLGRYERLALTSFVQRGHRVLLFTPDGATSVPEGVERRDIDEVLPLDTAFANPREPGTYAMFSNRFRYALLRQEEVTWIDADVVMVGSELPSGPYLFGYQNESVVASGVLRAPSRSELLAELIDAAFQMDPQTVEWGEMGPNLLTGLVQRLGLLDHAVRREVLFPIRPREVWMLFDPAQVDAVEERLVDSAAVHLWNELLRRAGPIALLDPPKGSWLDRRLNEIGHVGGISDRLEVDWVCRALGRDGPTGLQRIERLTRERDEARGKVARLSARVEKLKAERDALRAKSDWA